RLMGQCPGVVSVAQQAGRAELGEDTTGVEYSEIEVELGSLNARERQEVETRLNGLNNDFASFSFEAMPFLTERIKETLSGSPAALAVKIFGDDLEKLDTAATEIGRILNTVPGHAAVRIEPQTGAPEVVVRVRSEAAGRFGL